MSKTKVKGTVERYLESLSPEERKERDEGYRELLISEMIIAAMENDAVSVRELAKMANVSSNTVQNLRSGMSNSGVKSLFKVFQSLGYSVFAEKGDEKLTLVKPLVKQARSINRSVKASKVKEKPSMPKRKIEEAEHTYGTGLRIARGK